MMAANSIKTSQNNSAPLSLWVAVGAPLFGLFFQDAFSFSLVPVAVLFLVGVLGAIKYSFSNGVKCGVSPALILWGLFFVFTLLNNNQAIAHNVANTYCVELATLLVYALVLREAGSRLGRCFFSSVIAFAAIHGFITIVFSIVPPLCTAVRASLGLSSAYGYVAGITNHYSTNGTLILTGLIAAFASACKTRKRREIVLTAVLLLALILTSKRAHLAIGVFVCAVVYLSLNWGRLTGAAFKIACALIAGIAVFLLAAQLVPSLGVVVSRLIEAGSDDSFGGRSAFYQFCFDMWDKSPLLGWGWCAFPFEFAKTPTGMQLQSVGIEMMDAHNVYYQLLAEEGVVGVSLFVFVGAFCVVRCLAGLVRLIRGGRSEAVSVLATSFGMQVYFFLYCVTGNPLYDQICIMPYLLAVISMEATLPKPRRDGVSMRNRLGV